MSVAEVQDVFSCPKGIWSEPLTLRQTPAEGGTPGYRPATVRVRWSEGQFEVKAELEDEDVFNPVEAHNEPSFHRGDVFEMFLRPLSQEAYVELHVNPNNARFLLRIPRMEAFYTPRDEPGIPEDWFIRDQDFVSRVERMDGGWRVEATVPEDLIAEKGDIQPGDEWIVSFSRYDYSRSREEPIYASTSLHAFPDFHDQSDWVRMRMGG